MVNWCGMLPVFVAGMISSDCRKKPPILNNDNALIEDFPYQVSLQEWNTPYCGGAIISEKHILTAAHCVRRDMGNHRKVLIGTNYQYERAGAHEIAKVQLHPNFSDKENRGSNDIAVITLKDKIIFDKYRQKLNLPEHNPEAGLKVNITGWEGTRRKGGLSPKYLEQIQTQLATNENCQKKLGELFDSDEKITDTEICTLDAKGLHRCVGDTGSPLAADGVVYGIEAWTAGEYCGPDAPAVYTNVYKYKGFIESAMKA